MSHTVTATIDKLRMWCTGEWKTYGGIDPRVTNLTLRIHYDQFFILSGNKILESLNLNGKMKSIYKDDVLILIVFNSLQQMRKIKFQLKTNIAQCLQKLSLHIPVVNYNSLHSVHQSKYKDVNEVFKNAINGKGALPGPPLQPTFKDFVKVCLLDPSLPQILEDTQKILKDIVM